MAVDLRAVLRRTWMFSRLADAQIERLVELGRTRRVPARGTVISQGDPASDLYVVLEGRLKVSSANAGGDEVVLSILGPEDVFGEIALLDGEPRSATVAALEACELLVIQRDAFRDLLVQVPALAFSLLEGMARRVRVLTELTEDASLLDVPTRLAKTLLALAGRFGARAGGPEVTLTLKLSQQDLGQMIGATREMVNRCLRDWVKEGIIDTGDGHMVIRDEEALAARAGPRE